MKKKRKPNPWALSYQIEQMQQGGVYTPGVMPYDVVPAEAPGLNIPIPRIKNAVDGSQMIYRQQLLDQRQATQDFREQQAADRTLATSQAKFLDLQDKLFGDLHNPWQQAQFEQLKKEHNIPENITSDIFQDVYRLKDLEFSMSQALASDKFNNIMGEIGIVEKMRDSAYKTLTEDEYREWAKAYDEYQFSEDGKYDIKNLAPSLYQKKTLPKETDYASWLDSTANRDYLAGIDPTNQASLDQYYDDLAGEFVAKGAKEALDRGYIEYIDPANPDYGVILTQKGKDLALDKAEKAKFIKEGRYDEYVKKRRLGQQITQENRVFSDKLSDQNRAEAAKSGTGSSGGKETETEKKARLELNTLETKYGKIDRSEIMPNGNTIGDTMWKGVSTGTAPLAIEEIEKYLKSKGLKSTGMGGKGVDNPLDVLQFGTETSGAQQLLGGQ